MDTRVAIEKLASAVREIQSVIGEMQLDTQEGQAKACPGCGKSYPESKKFPRGVCHACYQALKRDVDSGKVSWEDLESRGVIEPPATPGRKPSRSAEKIAERVIRHRSTRRKQKKDG